MFVIYIRVVVVAFVLISLILVAEQVFRTPKKGWAVRCWDFIPSGSPICEYTGVLRRTDDVDTVSCNDYIFDIDCLQTMSGVDGRQVQLLPLL